MSSFLSARKTIKAEDLRGPRIYSTDLLPSLFDPNDPDGSIEVTARALKVKIITKGLVTLNSAYLLSPLAVLLMDRHPDLLNGPAILPAFRTDKDGLADLLSSNEDLATHGIGARRLEEHIARVEAGISQAIPWELGDVDQRFRALLLSGLENPYSLIVRTLMENGLDVAAVDQIIADLKGLPLSESISLRTYIGGLNPAAQAPLSHFSASCYHMIGTGVVRCEAGTDLNPLSAFKAADVFLAGRDSQPEMLSEVALFTEAFMGFALDTIQATALPTQILDSLDFATAHRLSEALRKQGFQDKYDGIVREYLNSAALPDTEEALEALEPQMIAHVAAELARNFQQSVIAELPGYSTRIQEDAKGQVIQAGADIAKDFVSSVPGLGSIVSFADAVGHTTQGLSALKGLRDVRDMTAALAAAQAQRTDKIQAAIASLKIGDQHRARFLDAVALMSDVHGLAIARA